MGGALRKWVVNSGNLSNAILLLQIVGFFFFFIMTPAGRKSPFWQNSILLFFTGFLFLQVVNPLQLTLFHGLLGFCLHGGFWLALFYYFNNRPVFKVHVFLWVFILVAVVEIVLVFIQYQLPASHFLNRYVNVESVSNTISTVGSAVRVTGTFSYLGGFTSFMFFYTFLIWVLFIRKVDAWISALAIVAGFFACFMSGSRGVTVIYIISLLFVLFNTLGFNSLLRYGFRLAIPLLLASSVIAIDGQSKVLEVAGRSFNNFLERFEFQRERGEQERRIFWDLNELNEFKWKYPVFGVGIGSTYQGATALFGKSTYVEEYGYYETETSRLILEGGFLLLLFKVLLCIALYKKLAMPKVMSAYVSFMVLYLTPTVFNVYNAAFIFCGIVMVDNMIFWKKNTLAAEAS